jgi:long-chain acyl-CoA synthetase
MNALFISKLTLFYGGSAVLLPRFDVEHYVRAIFRHQVTWLTVVPTMLALVVREAALLEVVDRSRVERVSMGSAPLTEALFDELEGWFPNALISNLYGTTEHGSSAFGGHPRGLARPKLSDRLAAQGMSLRLVGGPNDNTGVLEARSLSNMSAYKNLPDKTAEVMVDG